LTSCSRAQVRGNTVKLCTAGDRLNQCPVWYVTRRLTSCSRAQVKGKTLKLCSAGKSWDQGPVWHVTRRLRTHMGAVTYHISCRYWVLK